MSRKPKKITYDQHGVIQNHSPSLFASKLTPDDLPKLNEGIDRLAAALRKAIAVYASGKNSGRDGTALALIATNMFLKLFEVIEHENLTMPQEMLILALAGLNQNNQLPILTPTPRTGRASSSPLRGVLEGVAVVTVERITAMGTPLDKACDMVAKTLVKAGIKPSRGGGAITARTIKNWKQRASEDVAKSNAAALTKKHYDEHFKSDLIETPSEALDILLTMLEVAQPGNFK